MKKKNGVMMQGFQWYTWGGGGHWDYLANLADELGKAGITAMWIPPPYKCDDPQNNVGYGPYDLYDLGEYNQKESIRTKYGTRDQLLAAIRSLKKADIQVYIDAVFNHRGGADGTEEMEAIIVDRNDRRVEIPPWRTIRAWTRFDFKGRLSTERGRKVSIKTYSYRDFDAVDKDDITGWDNTVFKIKRKQFETRVSQEKGNYDYLMYADHDMDSPEVIEDLRKWGMWILEEAEADGFRIDAVKHIRSFFFKNFLGYVRDQQQKKDREVFAVGEYIPQHKDRTDELHQFLMDTAGSMSLFDVPLQTKFNWASTANPRNSFDLGSLGYGTLSSEQPTLAVTFVESHDTQRLQALEQPVEAWFKPWAYAFILLREQGYPCIFIADWTGAEYENVKMPSHKWVLQRLLAARKHYAYGPQLDYLDHRNTIGWTRLGDREHPKPMAVLISNSYTEGWKWMEVGLGNTPFIDLLEHRSERIFTNMHGWGRFPVNTESCSVWVPEDLLPGIKSMLEI